MTKGTKTTEAAGRRVSSAKTAVLVRELAPDAEQKAIAIAQARERALLAVDRAARASDRALEAKALCERTELDAFEARTELDAAARELRAVGAVL